MHYFNVEQARAMPGLRLVLTAGVPGPWGESAKAVLHLRGVEFTPVAQHAAGPNEALRAWTGVRNAPVAVYEDEPPRISWLEILMLAERLGHGASLLPARPHDRITCLGLSTEICAPWGLGWCRRLMILASLWQDEESEMATSSVALEQKRDYGYDAASIAAAPKRIVDILAALAEQLERQHRAGSEYLVGDNLTACDVYWACFSGMLDPLPHEVNPMPDWVRTLYCDVGPAIGRALDPLLIQHRNRIFERHIGLPLDY